MKKVLLAVVVALAAGLGACSQPKADEGGNGGLSAALPGPPYAEVAAKYNANADHLRQLFAYAVVEMQWVDKEGSSHKEQGEGRLQVVQPSHVALSIGKVGETFFWLGSDSQRYWWFDLSGKQRVMFVGAHANYEKSQARRIGVVVAPLDLVRLLGIMPLPESGVTQLSEDGKRIGVVNEITGGGRQRTWIDKASGMPVMVELFAGASSASPEVFSVLSEVDTVSVKGMGIGPRTNKKIVVAHPASSSKINIELSNMQDGAGRMVPEAFEADALARQHRVDSIYDLDTPAPKSGKPKR